MPRLMSFAATVEQMRSQTKTVTRRIDRRGWWHDVLQPGTLLIACEKTQGIPRGEKVQRIGVIEVAKVFRERLDDILNYDLPLADRVENAECIREGLGMLDGVEFIELFCELNECQSDVAVTRIEFRHRSELTTCCAAERRVWSSREGTNHYECSECGEAV